LPRPISWLPHLTAIRRSVSNSVREYYERRDLELLFKLQPSAAGKLLDILPTIRMGTSLLVERDALAGFLKEVAEAEDVGALLDRMRTERSARSRRKLRRRLNREPVGMTALPGWLKLERGRLTLDFETAEQLAEGMFMIARILDQELGDFCEAYEPASPIREDLRRGAGEMRQMFRELEQMEARAGLCPPAA
jgi:hypothetical protein